MNKQGSELARGVRTLGDIARVYAEARPDAMASKFEGRATTRAAFEAKSNQVAHGLLGANVQKGDRVGYLGKNTDFYFEILFGAAKMGAVTLPIGWRLAAAEIAHILDDGAVSLLFVGAEFHDLAKEAIGLTGRAVRILDLEGPSSEGFVAWRDAQPVSPAGVDIDPADPALQLYTSGTTGRPKGVMLNHRNLLETWTAAGQANFDWFQWSQDDVCLVAMPVSHIAGTSWGIVSSLFGSANLILREFDPNAVLSLMEPERITKMLMVPAALNFLIQMPQARQIDYSRLKSVFYGASPIPLDLLRQCLEVFGCGFCQQYGMTETAGTVVYLPPDDHAAEGNLRMRSAGRPMPGVELKVCDDRGDPLPPGTVGEVATRSASNMIGYWNNEAATNQTIDEEGWLYTGDAGYLDEDGYLFIHDRVKDMIISGAENIYPAEVESAMFGHPDIAEVAVIGVPDDKWGEAVKAVVALKPGAEATEAALLDFTRTRIAAFKVPKSVDFMDMLPRNASGKVLKRILREPYWAGKDRAVN